MAVCQSQERDIDFLNDLTQYWRHLEPEHSEKYYTWINTVLDKQWEYLSSRDVFYYLTNKSNTAIFLNHFPNTAVTENSNTGISFTKISANKNHIKFLV